MTIANALSFIKRGQADSALRARLNAAESPDELSQMLVAENLNFSAHDFDEAYHRQLTECQEEEDADQLKEFKMWWELLSQYLNPSACKGTCSSCG